MYVNKFAQPPNLTIALSSSRGVGGYPGYPRYEFGRKGPVSVSGVILDSEMPLGDTCWVYRIKQHSRAPLSLSFKPRLVEIPVADGKLELSAGKKRKTNMSETKCELT